MNIDSVDLGKFHCQPLDLIELVGINPVNNIA